MIRLRLVLIGAGVAAFAYALRTGKEGARWLGIALVAVALVLRFVRPRRTQN